MFLNKKILFCQPTLNFTGSEKSLLEILKGLSENKSYNLYVLGGKDGDIKQVYESYVEKTFITRATKLSKNAKSIFPFIISFFSVFRDMKKIKKEDNIRISYVNTLMFPQAILSGKLNGYSVITHIRETEDRYPKIIYYMYLCIAIIFSNRLIAVSNHILNQNVPLKKLFLKKTSVVYNSSSFKTPKIERNINKKNYSLLSVVPVSEKKGIRELISFANEFKAMLSKIDDKRSFILQIVGNTSDLELFEEIKSEILRNGLSENIVFAGETNDISDFYLGSDILVHPSPNESFGRVLIEAMNFSLPVISFDNGGAREIIQDEISGYIVKNRDYKEMANKVMELIVDSDLYNNLSRNAYMRYTNLFSIDCITNDLEKILENVIENKNK